MSEKKSGAVGRQYHLAVVEKKDREIDALAAEVRRLRAMLEPTQDALELAKEIVDYVSEEEYGAIAFAAKLIAAHDARLLDEAAERAIGWFEDQTWGCEFDGMAITPDLVTLRAAIKGYAHE